MESIVIVRQAGWRFLNESDADSLIRLMRIWLEKGGVEVSVAKTFEEAKGLLAQSGASSLIFISANMPQEARVVKDSYPATRVVIFTGLMPSPKGSPVPLDGLVFIEKPSSAQEFVRLAVPGR